MPLRGTDRDEKGAILGVAVESREARLLLADQIASRSW